MPKTKLARGSLTIFQAEMAPPYDFLDNVAFCRLD
jgi:hypothetical protein